MIFYFLITLVIALNYFIHPLSLFLPIFSIGFICIYKNQWKRLHVYITLLLIILMLMSKFLFPSHPYEANYFEGLKHPWTILPVIHKTPMVKFILRYFGEFFIYFLIPLVVAVVIMIKKRQFGAAVFCFLFSVFYVILTAISTYKGDAPVMLEIRLVLLIFMVIIPLGFLLKDQKKSFMILSGIIMLLTTSYIHIVLNVQKNHTKRLETYAWFLKEASAYNTTKFFVRLPHNKTPLNSWGSAGETLMLSSLDGPENSKTIIFIDDEMHIEEGINSYPCTFLWVKWWLYANEEYLNKKYFNLQCGKYQELIYPDDLK